MAFSRRRAPVALVAALLLAAPGGAFALEPEFKLVLAPVGQAGPYFDVVMDPGDTAQLEVTLGNDGSAGVAARTYAADVFTITNGGYGGRLRDAAQTGATTWLTYPPAVLDLPPGRHLTRSLTVTVPADATPGEYISSLVIENDASVGGEGAIGFDQIVREAIAVVVTVPGPRTPELRIGDAHHEVVAGRSVVTIAVQNSGNVRLRPVVAFLLRDAGLRETTRSTFQMDTFFAHTDTLVSVSLASLLPQGSYTIELTLTDTEQGVVATDVIPLVVGAPTATETARGEASGLAPIGPGGIPGSLALVIAVLVMALAAVAMITAGHLRRQRRLRPVSA